MIDLEESESGEVVRNVSPPDETVIVKRVARDKIQMKFHKTKKSGEPGPGVVWNRFYPQAEVDKRMPTIIPRDEATKALIPLSQEKDRKRGQKMSKDLEKAIQASLVTSQKGDMSSSEDEESRDRNWLMLNRLKEQILQESRSEMHEQQRLRASTLCESLETRKSSKDAESMDEYRQMIDSRDKLEKLNELNAKLMKQMFIDDRDEEAWSSENASDFNDKVEYASDDEVPEGQVPKKRKKRKEDSELRESDLEDSDEQDGIYMDELENESLSIGSEEKRRKKELQRMK